MFDYFGNSIRLVVARHGSPAPLSYTYMNRPGLNGSSPGDAFRDMVRRLKMEARRSTLPNDAVCAAVIVEFDGPFHPQDSAPTYTKYEGLHKLWTHELNLWSDPNSTWTSPPEYPLLDPAENPGCYGAQVIAEFYDGVSDGPWPEVLLKQLETYKTGEDPSTSLTPTPDLALPQPASHSQLDLF